MNNADKKKLNNLIFNRKVKWSKEYNYYEENKAWLDKSMKIATKINLLMKEKEISEDDLRILTKIPRPRIEKIIKGEANLNLKVIARLETILGSPLI